MLRIAVLFVVSFAGLPTQQSTASSADRAREQDVYAVYSTLMSNPPVIGGGANSTYAIAASTMPLNLERAANPELPEAFRKMFSACDAPPPAYENQWQEILLEFRARGDAPVPLLRELKITKPYVYLTDAEVSLFLSAHSSIGAPPIPNPQFGGAVAVIRLSNIYFNKDRTLAVTYISSTCGALCGHGERKIFERIPTGWREVTSGTRCTVDA